MSAPLDASAADMERLHLWEAALGADSLIEYVPRITPQWMEPWHLRPVAELFNRAQYEPVRACVSVPPRHGKTELLLHAIGWWLSRRPATVLAYVTYSGDLAKSKSNRALALAKQSGITLDPSTQRADEWRTPYDGGVLATGIGGPLTGHGADVLIIDDPTKNREEAESPTVRRKVWEWFTSTALTRMEPGSSAIVVHTRWHPDDLIGRLDRGDADGSTWEYVNLPAVDEQGAALWPERWNEELLDIKRRDVGEYDWWSMFMGQPRPRGGKLFREATTYGRFPDLEGSSILISCDPAASTSTHSDHSAIAVGAGKLLPTGLLQVDLLDIIRLQVEVPVLAHYLAELQAKWQAPIVVESVGGFKAVPQMLRTINKGLRIIEVTPTADKFTRTLPAAAAWNDGRIRTPVEAAWLGDFLYELSLFTGISDPHDDQVDALAHLYSTFDALLRKQARKSGIAPGLPFG